MITCKCNSSSSWPH